MRNLTKILSLFALLSLNACAPCPWDDSQPPSIDSFTSNMDSVMRGASVELTLETSFFELRGDEGHDHEDDHGDDHGDDHNHSHGSTDGCPGGHWHLYLDDLMTNPIAESVVETASIVIPEDTPLGPHTLIARLHNEDHTILIVDGEEVWAELALEVEELEVPGR
jgi:hypothetical protein